MALLLVFADRGGNRGIIRINGRFLLGGRVGSGFLGRHEKK
jgi:hypothetical protein